eukprot:TRINITY_DN19462_c0_g1_i1.p1 TRINITY_DN19462_c0_g1~~TRINITY_DN19462_c0_g1_i1.p1  ORF type:complete len:242 (+),score=36.92 TRINITY_DN19462_c0_g1_i1:67-792(+)
MALPPISQALLSITTFFMVMSGFSLMMMADAKKDISIAFNKLARLVTVFASVSYLFMALGYGVIEVEGRNVYWLRYVDWCFDTPCMLLAMGLVVGAEKKLIAALVVLDELMMGFGIMATLYPTMKWQCFALGTLAFVPIVTLLSNSLHKKAEELGGSSGALYKWVAGRTVEVWCCYPVLFTLCEATSICSEDVEVAGYAVIDVLSKCGIPLMVYVSSMAQTRSNSTLPLFQAKTSSVNEVQ